MEYGKELLLVFLLTATAPLLIVSPGLILRRQLSFRARKLHFIWTPVPGLLGLALLGTLVWLSSRWASPHLISCIGLWTLVLLVCVHFVCRPVSVFLNETERRVLLIVMVLIAIGVAKSIYSIGPAGELYAGTISRTLEVSGRSDSRISYHIVQLVAARSRPYGYLAAGLRYNFSHGGPLAGLAVSPLVLAGPQRPPAVIPNHRWAVFDTQGFTAYRIAMISMTCSSLLVVFGLSRLFLSTQWSLLAFLVTATAPFVIHETYFTWPKLLSASFVLLAVYLTFRSRDLAAGLVLGLAYLFHPSGLFGFPAMVDIVILTSGKPGGARPASRVQRIAVSCLRALYLASGVAFWIVVWWLVNRHHYAQSGLLPYFLQAGGLTPTPSHWLYSRWVSLSNTIVPLYLFMFHRFDQAVNSMRGPSPMLVQFFFQEWTGVPFGAGIGFFFCLLCLLYLAFKKARAWLLLLVVLPFFLFVCHWGGDTTGLLREGLHAWFLGLLIFIVVIWRRYASHFDRFWRFFQIALLMRMIEIPLMLVLPAIWTRHAFVQRKFALSDSIAFVTMLSGSVWLCVTTLRHTERLRKSYVKN